MYNFLAFEENLFEQLIAKIKKSNKYCIILPFCVERVNEI